MYAQINEVLPKFRFLNAFLRGLKGKYRAYIPSEEEKTKIMNTLWQIHGEPACYMMGEVLQWLSCGVVREARRYEDGSCFARIETRDRGRVAELCPPQQVLLHLSREWRLLAYTLCNYHMVAEDCVYGKWGCDDVSCPVGEVEDLLDVPFRMEFPDVLSVEYSPYELARDQFKISALDGDDGTSPAFRVEMSLIHYPWVFVDSGLSCDEASDLLRVFVEEGLGAVQEHRDWRVDSARIWQCISGMAVNVRLWHYRLLAELEGNGPLADLLEKSGITSEPQAALWVRAAGDTWPERMSDLCRQALDGRLREPMRCHCLLYAALEGDERARTEFPGVAFAEPATRRFGVRD